MSNNEASFIIEAVKYNQWVMDEMTKIIPTQEVLKQSCEVSKYFVTDWVQINPDNFDEEKNELLDKYYSDLELIIAPHKLSDGFKKISNLKIAYVGMCYCSQMTRIIGKNYGKKKI
jgi:hypothetical protein